MSILSEAGWDALRGLRIPMAGVVFTLDGFPDFITSASALTTRPTGSESGRGGTMSEEKELTDAQLSEHIAWLKGLSRRRADILWRMAELSPAVQEHHRLKQEWESTAPSASGRTERFERSWAAAQELLRRELAKP